MYLQSLVFGALLVATILHSATANAQCTNPAATAGGLNYVSSSNEYELCDGTNWGSFTSGGAIDNLSDGYADYATGFNFFLGHEGGVSFGSNNLNNTAVGVGTMDALDDATSASNWGDNNAAFGNNAVTNNTRGFANTAVGIDALSSNTTGHSNTAIGYDALSGSTNLRNVAVGSGALGAIGSSGANGNVGVGNSSGFALDFGNDNVFIGYRTAHGETTNWTYDGANNVIIGSQAAENLDNSNNQNTIIGAFAAPGLTGGGSNNILLGYGVDVSSATASNEINIGDVIFASGLYNATAHVGINESTPTAALDVIGDIEYTGVIRDVSDIRMKENIKPISTPLASIEKLSGFSFTMKGGPSDQVEYGVSAQEVQAVFPELVSEVDQDGTLGVSYTGLIPPMIEAIKELSSRVEILEAENKQLKAQINSK